MKFLSATVLTLTLCQFLYAAEEKATLSPTNKEVPDLQLMPPGSILKKVRLPRYEQSTLKALMLAEIMRVVSKVEMSGEDIDITLQNEEGQPTHIKMDKASYFFDVEKLISESLTDILDPRFKATGAGIVLDTLKLKGFLSGPVTSTIPIKPSTTKP